MYAELPADRRASLDSSLASDEFRLLMAELPTSVVALTGYCNGQPRGLTIGSLVSISLDPQLVGIFVGRSSRNWPEIRDTKRFCANVLRADQEHVARRLASSADDKFDGVDWRLVGDDLAVLPDSCAWLDCTILNEMVIGDHSLVVGSVNSYATSDDDDSPMVFYRRRYRALAS